MLHSIPDGPRTPKAASNSSWCRHTTLPATTTLDPSQFDRKNRRLEQFAADRPADYLCDLGKGGKNLLQVVLKLPWPITRHGDRGHRWPEPAEERAVANASSRTTRAGVAAGSALRQVLRRRQPDRQVLAAGVPVMGSPATWIST